MSSEYTPRDYYNFLDTVFNGRKARMRLHLKAPDVVAARGEEFIKEVLKIINKTTRKKKGELGDVKEEGEGTNGDV